MKEKVKTMDAEKPKGKWFKQLLIQGFGDETGTGGASQSQNRFSFRRESHGSVASRDNGSDLLEDFPSAPRRLRHHGQGDGQVHGFGRSSVDTDDIRALNDSLSIPGEEAYEPPPAILPPPKVKKQVQIVMENSTTHSYERPRMTAQEIKSLYTSSIDKKFFMQSSMMMAKQIRHHLRVVSSTATSTTVTAVASNHPPVLIANRDIPPSILDELESAIECMFPSPANLSSSSKFAPEEVIGIEHLIGNKRLLVLLNDIRSYHSKSVLEQCRSNESSCRAGDGAEIISEASMRISCISMLIARRRAEYVANLE
ncbi:hypothetical protein ACHAXS_007823 [Conticribra weissflogii]